MSKHFLSASIILLSIAIFFFSYQLEDSNTIERNPSINTNVNLEKGLLTLEEAASYLSMTEEKFTRIIRIQDRSREVLSSFDTYSYIPYLQIGEEKYFNKEQIDEWIKYNTIIWKNVEF